MVKNFHRFEKLSAETGTNTYCGKFMDFKTINFTVPTESTEPAKLVPPTEKGLGRFLQRIVEGGCVMLPLITGERGRTRSPSHPLHSLHRSRVVRVSLISRVSRVNDGLDPRCWLKIFHPLATNREQVTSNLPR